MHPLNHNQNDHIVIVVHYLLRQTMIYRYVVLNRSQVAKDWWCYVYRRGRHWCHPDRKSKDAWNSYIHIVHPFELY